jgi:origin recognition complex subunit 5
MHALEHADADRKALPSASAGKLDVELPYYSKNLLVAAFLASYNPPSRDVATFSLTSAGPMKKRKRGGRLGPGGKAIAKDAKGTGAATKASSDALLQAPQTFGLERLLAIFYTVTGEAVDASAELLGQLSGLISLGLLCKIGNSDHLGDCKLSCRASYSLVQSVAADVRIELARFLHHDS